MCYTIIIPLYNEEKLIPQLLLELEKFSYFNQVLIINDGSTDSSNKLLTRCNHITLNTLDKNYGKGYSIQTGLREAIYNKIIIFDGDLELETNDIKKLMILDKSKSINFVIGSRYKDKIQINSIWDIGNYFFRFIFNKLYKSTLNDVLCCSKSFYKSDLDLEKVKSIGFDIDIEILSFFINKFEKTIDLHLSYNRRKIKEGKKINIKVGWIILVRLIKSYYLNRYLLRKK